MNPDHAADDHAKVDEYFRVIQERILAPIGTTDVRRSCTATLLLLFAAMDGLGHLLRPRHSNRSTDRIAFLLDYMGEDYAVHQKGLLRLRNELVHHAINVASFLSHAELRDALPIRVVGDVTFVNTLVMYRDFTTTLSRCRGDIERDPALMKRAADRLEWCEIDDPLEGANHRSVSPSPPPPIQFIRAK